jgi:signal peptidase I
MRPPRHVKKILSAVVALLALAVVWVMFAPTGIGGSTSWVVTDGISMEPHFHAGDLVLVRRQSDYRVGEIVAYRNRQLDTIVLHRIVARAGSRYVFKGDNNNFLDFEHPGRAQLLGALWIHLPGAGKDLASVRSPALIGILFGLAVLLFGGAAFTRRRRRRRHERRSEQQAAIPALAAHVSASPAGVLTGLLVATVPFLALALLAYTRPSSSETILRIPYEQRGTFSYSAQTTPGAAYPDGRAVTGEPLFTHLVHALDVHFAYTLQSHGGSGRVRARATLAATLSSSSGWRTTIPLAGPHELGGARGALDARIDLRALLRLISSVESSTAVRGAYTLTIAPHVRTTGSIAGAPLHAGFSPVTKFSLNQLELRPITASGATASEAQPSAATFTSSAAGSVSARHSRSASMSLGVASMSVSSARTISLAFLALLSCLLLAAIMLLRPRRRDETTAILARYGALIVPVDCVWQQPGLTVIDVAGIDALVKLAAHYERSILHEQTEYGNAFWVTDESGQFRYAVWAEEAQAEEWEAEPAGEEILVGDTREAYRGDTVEFGAASAYRVVAP